MFEKYNHSLNTIREGIDLQSMEFRKLAEFVGQTVKVDGFFFTDGDFGRQVVIVGNGAKINMPARAVKIFEDIQSTPEELQAVLDGKLKIVDIAPYKRTTSFTLTD